ncbi:uncharacterized protein LOC122399544 isoform X2 [Colletes gigas]|uniref:uncharacterized protein LOC122399544 isoform X2 n=1 Tax=Colletes gigas TaxID=935657 RepID=UPI001C9B744D|nr:uncharacterized protein LOC122399544 isoform X2 [Colletes gigas]
MCSNYFEKLVVQARQLDDGIEKLSETWKLPHVLVGRFTGSTEEANSHIEALWNDIRKTEEGIEELLSKRNGFQSPNSVFMEEFLQETKETYQSLKEQSDFLESVLAEHGYHYENNPLDDNLNNDISNQCLLEETKHSEAAVTPNFNSNYGVKQRQQETPASNGSYTPYSIATHMTNSSALFSGDTSIHRDNLYTPFKERPQESVYSTHFYNLLKK